MTRVGAAAGRFFVLAPRRMISAVGRAEGRREGMRERLRRAMGFAGPMAAALLVVVIAGAVTWRLEQSRVAALALSARVLDLRAGELAHKVDDALEEAPQTDPGALLAKIFGQESGDLGVAYLTDPEGAVRAAWPHRANEPA